MSNSGGGCRISGFFIRSNSCVHLGILRVNCDLPKRVLRHINIGKLHFFIRNRGLFAVAGCDNCSPRIKAHSKFSKKACPRTHACAVNTGVAF